MPGEPIRDLQSVLTQPTNIGAMATRSFCKREKYTFNFLKKQEENIKKRKYIMQIVLTHLTNIGAMATRLFCKREKKKIYLIC